MMTNTLQQLLDSSFGISLASALGRGLPLHLGYKLADYIASRIADQRDSRLIRAMRANQWVIRGEALGKEALDQAVSETLQHSARSIFDLYHYNQRLELTRRLLVMDETTQRLIERPEFSDRGLMIVGLHISNFDLALQTLSQIGLKMIVLTIPDPQGGRRAEFEMRKRTSMNLLPASVEAFRHALTHLRKGGIVLTGIDRPAPEAGTHPCFFGRPTVLPTHHIFLATKARVPVMIIAANLRSDGKYHILTSDFIEMEYYQDREEGMILNAEKVLRVAEGFIRQVPQQWSMSLPVWPEALDLVPE